MLLASSRAVLLTSDTATTTDVNYFCAKVVVGNHNSKSRLN
jgi:hypothetical protein